MHLAMTYSQFVDAQDQREIDQTSTEDSTPSQGVCNMISVSSSQTDLCETVRSEKNSLLACIH